MALQNHRATRHQPTTHAQRRAPVQKRVRATIAALLVAGFIVAAPATAQSTNVLSLAAIGFPIASLDGSGNNVANPTWGQAGRPYLRVAPAFYADGVGAAVGGPNARFISNRIMNDIDQNVFSERRVTQWGWTWGQFLDHTFGLRAETGPTATPADIPFNAADPLEDFTNTLGVIPFSRTNATAGTGTSPANPRQQDNTTSTYLNAFAVYGGTNTRLDWLRQGSVNGNPTDNSALLLLPNGFLPSRNARGNPAAAPPTAIDGRLLGDPTSAKVAGDVRVNENLALTATHTLFAREHNRIVSLLPSGLSEEDKFQIARRVVMAEQQFITYNEWLPAMGVALPQYTGYKPGVNATLSNEFAAVGYRVHSQIHGEFEFVTEASRYSAEDLAFFESQAVEFVVEGDEIEIAVPLNVAFFNPVLLERLEIGPFFTSLLESQYNNDEQIDNQLRSVLFQIPVPDNPDCGAEAPECFEGVVDLGAIDIERGRDHGIPRYNALRQAYGLPARTSFTAITGEATSSFPPGSGVNNPNSLDIVSLVDIDGNPVPVGEDGATRETRASTIAARLQGIYSNVNNVDAFVGMVAEPHVPGTEFGELQLAIWTKQFQALRDGDRFFYANDPALAMILNQYGIDFRRTLGQIIADNTDADDEANINVFLVAEDELPAPACTVSWVQTTAWPNHFQINLAITNNSAAPVNGWTLRWEFANGQTITSEAWGGAFSQSGPNGRDVRVTNAGYNGTIPSGGSVGGIGFNATWDDVANGKPPNFSLNNRRCATALG